MTRNERIIGLGVLIGVILMRKLFQRRAIAAVSRTNSIALNLLRQAFPEGLPLH